MKRMDDELEKYKQVWKSEMLKIRLPHLIFHLAKLQYYLLFEKIKHRC